MADITVNFDRGMGKIKLLHGVNNGPEGYGSLVDVSHYYRKIQIPSVRLHDPNWPHAWEIDIHTIFPDFSKDPTDPENYDFSRSDVYIRKILDTGAKILFRLGESIEHTEKKYYVHPPADYGKWAQICIGIIRHYNDGWVNGYEYGIEYWEIWNEPDVIGQKMWSGTDEQYYELYRVAAPAIKSFDPKLKVGGPAAAGVKSDFMQGFLQTCKKENLPLDFYSWHTYTTDPELIRSNCFYIREQLDNYGFQHTESIFNEWNYFDSNLWKSIFLPESEYIRKNMFERSKGPEGASFAAAVLMLLQDCPVDSANYYDGQPSALFCGLFDYYGVPQKTYFAFEAFHQLAQFPEKVEVQVDKSAQGLYCCAAKSEMGAAILMSNFSAETRLYHLQFLGLEKDKFSTWDEYRLDFERNLQLEGTKKVNLDEMSLLLPQRSVTLLKLSRE